MGNSADSAITMALRNGDTHAYLSMINKYREIISKNVFLFTKDPLAVNDLATDTFAALWRSRHRLDTEKSILPYLIAISKNKCIDYLKEKKKRNEEKEKLTEYEKYIKENDIYYDKLEEKEQLKMILEAISFISSSKCRKVAIMYFIDQKQNHEIATELQIQVQVVKNMLSSSRKVLKERIKKLSGV
jgi:RNA polymerase sigma-70 factor (ECF subfamily)